MKTPILGSTYVARSVNAADARMINLFPEIVPEGGKEPAFLQRCPGLTLRAVIGDGPIRGLWQYNGNLYVASGNKLYKVNSSWNSTLLGVIGGTGPVSMADNGTQLFVATNPNGYIYNDSTGVFQQITSAGFRGASVVGYLDGYFVFIEPNSQKVWVTALLEGTSVDPLDFASAEGSPDGLVSMIVDHRELWLLGTNSTEVWYDAGGTAFPLAPIQGAYNELGCAAAFSVAKMDNQIFWLGQDARGKGIVYKSAGYIGQRISTHAVEWQIQQYSNISDAVAYTYQQDGHSFYVLNFPTADTTWVYDASTQVWHERAGWKNGDWVRHRANNQAFFNGETIVGDYQNADLYALDLMNHTDNGDEQRWLRSWRALPTGQNNLKRTAQHTLQLDCETGVGILGLDRPVYLLTENSEKLLTENFKYICVDTESVTFGVDPQVMLRWSDDGGHTWSNEHWKSMGKIGQFGYRTIWRRLGMTMKIRDRVYEVSGTDPVKVYIMGAELILDGTNA